MSKNSLMLKSSKLVFLASLLALFSETLRATETYIRCVGESTDRMIFSSQKSKIDDIYRIDIRRREKIVTYDSEKYIWKNGALDLPICEQRITDDGYRSSVSCDISATKYEVWSIQRDKSDIGYWRTETSIEINRQDGAYKVKRHYRDTRTSSENGIIVWAGQCSSTAEPGPPKTKF